MKMRLFFMLCGGGLLYYGTLVTNTTPFVIITASYNNEEWCQRNLESILTQEYQNWRLIYINDCSTDATYQIVTQLVDRYDLWHKVTIINNEQRMGHLYNQYHAIHSCANDEVVVNVDGDDWFIAPDILSYLDTIYSQGNVWLTYGQFWYWKRNRLGCSRQIPTDILNQNSLRDYPIWITSHLRTFYAGLYKMIELEDLLYEGKFFPMCADVATMIPMIEMAHEHTQFISKILYMYNDANSASFFHDRENEQRQLHKHIRSLPRYQKLSYPVFLQENHISSSPKSKLPYYYVPIKKLKALRN